MRNSRRDTISVRDAVAFVFRCLEELGANAAVITNKGPVLYSGGEARHRGLEHLFGFSDDGAACLFHAGKAYIVTDSRYETELKERFAGMDCVSVSISRDDPENSCYLSIAKLANEWKDAPFVLAVNEKVTHSDAYLGAVKGNPKIRILPVDILEKVWKDRPEAFFPDIDDMEDLGFPESFEKIFPPRVSKLNMIAASLADEGAQDGGFVVFSNPSDVAWALNIRCFANAPSMLPPSILVLSQEKGYLFIQGRLGGRLAYTLSNLSANDEEKSIIKEISAFSLDDFFNKAKYLIPISSALRLADFDCAALALDIFPPGKYAYKAYDRFWLDKTRACLTAEESKSMKMAFGFDSVAFARLLNRKERGERFADEMSVSSAILEERRKNKYFLADSFETISAFGPNGAICHYAPSREGSRRIEEGLLVLDFGSQYDFGTTDSTRTIAFGRPTDEEKKIYTAVLKAHIRLQMLDFPFGTDGYRLDFLARSVLYEYGIEVPHGIGHGVEMIGNVHAAFPRLGGNMKVKGNAPLFGIFPGMVFTIEPGAYLEGKFGVRIENTVLAVAREGKGGFMRFEPLTLMPYDISLIDRTMLTGAEIDFVNAYHLKIRSALESSLNEEEKNCLRRLTREI